LVLVFLAVLAALAALAQRGRFSDRPFQTITVPVRNGEFHFIRWSTPTSRARGAATASPRATAWRGLVDDGLARRRAAFHRRRLAPDRVDAGDPRHFRLTDPRLFDYPWIYATQTAWWDLSDAEVARLREYLLRGGTWWWTTCGAPTSGSYFA
jgi:hypothetical protein